MFTKSLGVALAALFVLTGMIISIPVSAADTIGYVDVQAVFDGYEKTIKSKADLENLNKDLELKLSTMDANRLLSDAEIQELITLVTKPAQTDKDKERIKALQDQEKALDAELKGLQGKSELTAQEKARLKELQDRQAASEEKIKQSVEESRNQLTTKGNSLTEEIRNDILKAIEAVAKQKNLSAVVDKIAVLYGGIDITQPVIDKLNGKK